MPDGLVYIPLNLGEVPDYYRRFIDPPDIAVIRTTPADDQGISISGRPARGSATVIERAKTVIVEVSPNLPYVFGRENGVHISEVDYIIEGGETGATELKNAPMTDVDRAVAGYIAENVDDGACVQIGIGAMPNAVCTLLAQSGIEDLGIHTEMLTDGMHRSRECGPRDGREKTAGSGQGRVHLRARVEVHVRRDHAQPRDGVPPRRLHQPAARHHAE